MSLLDHLGLPPRLRERAERHMGLTMILVGLAVLGILSYVNWPTISSFAQATYAAIPPIAVVITLVVTGLVILSLAAFKGHQFLERLRSDVDDQIAAGANLDVVSGTFAEGTLVDPKASRDKTPGTRGKFSSFKHVAAQAQATGDMIVVLPDSLAKLKWRQKSERLAFWIAHLFPTPPANGNIEQARDHRQKQLGGITQLLSDLRLKRSKYSSIALQLAFHDNPERSGTATTTAEALLPHLQRLPHDIFFVDIYTPGKASVPNADASESTPVMTPDPSPQARQVEVATGPSTNGHGTIQEAQA